MNRLNRNLRKVVISRYAISSNLGISTETCWDTAKDHKNSFLSVENDSQFSNIKLPSKVIGKLNVSDESLHELLLDVKERKQLSRASLLSLLTVKEVLKDFSFSKDKTNSSSIFSRFGVSIGSGMEGLHELTSTFESLSTKGYSTFSPFTLTRVLGNMPAGIVSKYYGFKGPCISSNMACATGLGCVGDAFRSIQLGEVDIVLAGGTESALVPWSLAAFGRIRALSTKFNDAPEKASRPFDKKRDGFVMSEGCGILLVHVWPLPENLRKFFHNDIVPIAQIVGFGRSCDASNLVAPEGSGDGAFRAMLSACEEANLTSMDQLGNINCHATSTPLGDAIELAAISRFLKHLSSLEKSVCFNLEHKVVINSLKGHLGHSLGACGATELVLSIEGLRRGEIITTANLEEPLSYSTELLPRLEGFGSNYAAKCLKILETKTFLPLGKDKFVKWPKGSKYLLKNSFGFGGTNISLLIKKMTI